MTDLTIAPGSAKPTSAIEQEVEAGADVAALLAPYLESGPPTSETKLYMGAAVDLRSLAVPRRIWDQALGTPVREFLGRRGKQARGRLVRLANKVAGGHGAGLEPMIAAVEAVHAGSLIIDDIEDGAMNRRGRPALHRMIGTPMAINTGNWLYFAAMDLLRHSSLPEPIAAAARDDVQATMLRCHYGQALDLAVQIERLDRGEVPGVVAAVTALKTGTLCALAMRLGALAAGADVDGCERLGLAGQGIGEILQMLDDWSGLTSPRRLAKGGEDLLGDRPTWPWAWLAESLTDREWQHLRRGLASARSAPATAESIAALALTLRGRLGDGGAQRIRARMEVFRKDLAPLFTAAALDEMQLELDRLEAGFD